jgi:hypothetical protein
MNKIVCYPVHSAAILQKDYSVKVRALGEKDWNELATYCVKVDMHDVHMASMSYFDFEGEVEVEISGPWYIYQVDIRPLSKNIEYICDTKVVRFILNNPMNLSIELNRDRYHNLHLFAGRMDHDIPNKYGDNVLLIRGSMDKPDSIGGETMKRLESMPKGRTLYIEAGMHYIFESTLKLPSDTNIYLEGGCTVIGSLVCSNVENVNIYGRGMIYLADFPRMGGMNGVRISHSQNISVKDLIFINPPHYTIYVGGSSGIRIQNIKAFSCEGWSDGIDIMSSQNILVEGGFLRNSDDCIAIYGRRWSYNGDTRNIVIKDLTVWADVAHPLNVGGHGDILEHNEYQYGYLGCMAINAGDKNTVRNITYENIRIEPFKRGKLLDFRVLFNPKYNPTPGKRIENIVLKNIQYHGSGEVTSTIQGYSEEFIVDGVYLKDIIINDKKAITLEEANIEWGVFAKNISIE